MGWQVNNKMPRLEDNKIHQAAAIIKKTYMVIGVIRRC